MKTQLKHLITLVSASLVSAPVLADSELSAGVWWVYQNGSQGDGAGEFADPAFILYADDDGSHGPWHFSGELRVGKGSFTNPQSNNSGDNFAIHKAWLAYDFDKNTRLTVGKSQVPFGWKTVNFWPGDMLMGGYGDQMDIGAKLSSSWQDVSYQLAYYHQDDWGKTSTDTTDDNGHWGSNVEGSETYRKGKTLVANADWKLADAHTLGISLQAGKLMDLARYADTQEVSQQGDHSAIDVHYYFNQAPYTVKYRSFYTERDYSGFEVCASCPSDKVETLRHAAHLGYSQDDFYYFFELTAAQNEHDTAATDDTVYAFAPGVIYDYGPGWLYFEYLWQDGYIDQFGGVGEGDFKSFYVSFDYYFN